MASKKKSHNGTRNLKAQEQFRKEQGRYKSNLKAGNADLRTIIIGDGAVWKTTLLFTYTTNEFPSECIPTVFDNYTLAHKYNDKTYQINLWDTAGKELKTASFDFERFGGSRAQRDLLEFTYVNVLMRSGNKEAARKTLLERRPNFYEMAPIETIAQPKN